MFGLAGGGLCVAGEQTKPDQTLRVPTPILTQPQETAQALAPEPKLTHIVKVYWSALDGMVTNIKVTASGRRPTQIECERTLSNKTVQLFSTLNPRCDYNLYLGTKDEKSNFESSATVWPVTGEGLVTVRVYGFEQEDATRPPEVTVQYRRGGQLIGETNLSAE